MSSGRGQKKGKKITEALCRWRNAAFCQHNSGKKREQDGKVEQENAQAFYSNSEVIQGVFIHEQLT